MSGMTSKKMLSMHVFSHLGMHVLDIRKVVLLRTYISIIGLVVTQPRCHTSGKKCVVR